MKLLNFGTRSSIISTAQAIVFVGLCFFFITSISECTRTAHKLITVIWSRKILTTVVIRYTDFMLQLNVRTTLCWYCIFFKTSNYGFRCLFTPPIWIWKIWKGSNQVVSADALSPSCVHCSVVQRLKKKQDRTLCFVQKFFRKWVIKTPKHK